MTSPTNPSLTSPLDYARLGRLGIGTPQANPTVEAEIRRLLPFEVDTVTLRLTSDSADAATRLKSYLVNLPQHAKQFAGMPDDEGIRASPFFNSVNRNVARIECSNAVNATSPLPCEICGSPV